MCLKTKDAIFFPDKRIFRQKVRAVRILSLEPSSVHEGCCCARHFAITSPTARIYLSLEVKRKLLSHALLFATLWTIQPMEFSRPEYCRGQPFPSPGHLPNSGIRPRSPTLQLDSLPAEPQGKPTNTVVGSLSLLQGSFLTQASNQGFLHCRQILYYERSQIKSCWHLVNIC